MRKSQIEEEMMFYLRCRKYYVILRYFSFFLIFFCCSACQTQVALQEEKPYISKPEKIAILPFKDMTRIYGENVHVRSPLSGKVFRTGNVLKGADETLNEHLFSLLTKIEDLNLVPADQAKGVFTTLLSLDQGIKSDHELSVETGRALNADAVMVGHIFRFTDRIGNNYSVQSPASVAFDLNLIDVADGRILWNGNFDETQQALSENVLQFESFFKRRGTWITAREMALAGLSEMIRTFPVK